MIPPLLLALTAQQAGTPPPRGTPQQQGPYVDPRLRRYAGLVDSLSTISGLSRPDSIVQRRLGPGDRPNATMTGAYNPVTRTLTVSPRSSDFRRTLTHEFGHVFMEAEPELFYLFVDSILKQRVEGQRGPDNRIRIVDRQAEPYADAFADAFEALARSDTTKLRPGPSYLARLLSARPPFVKPPEEP